MGTDQLDFVHGDHNAAELLRIHPIAIPQIQSIPTRSLTVCAEPPSVLFRGALFIVVVLVLLGLALAHDV